MSEWIDDLGFDDDVPAPAASADGSAMRGLSREDYFLLSRIDARTTIGGLFTMSGQTRSATVETLRRLHDRSLIDLPNREPRPSEPTPPAGSAAAAVGLPNPDWFGGLEAFEPDEASMRAESALPGDLRRLLLFYDTYRERVTYYDMLMVPRKATKDDITTAYYRLSKLFHPDKWFRQPLGPFEMPLRDTFAWISKAYRTLKSKERRSEYEAVLQRGVVGPWAIKEPSAPDQPRSRFTRGEATGHTLGRNALLARGRRLVADRQYRQAASCFRKALALGDDAKLALELAEVQIAGKFDLGDALASVRRIVAESPKNYAFRLLEAKILKLLGARDDARDVLRAILREQPNHSAALAKMRALADE